MAKSKFYAIRKGRKDNTIVTTWNECEDLIKGYHGAEYKAFSDERDAKQYLGINNSMKEPIIEEPKKETISTGYSESRIINNDFIEEWKEEINIRIPRETRKLVENRVGTDIKSWIDGKIKEVVKEG